MVTKSVDSGFDEMDDVEEDVTLPSVQEKIPTIDQVVTKHVKTVLDRVDGNKSMAARLLNIDRRTLYRYIKKMGLA